MFVEEMAAAQTTGIPKWVARSVSGNMGQNSCGLRDHEPHPNRGLARVHPGRSPPDETARAPGAAAPGAAADGLLGVLQRAGRGVPGGVVRAEGAAPKGPRPGQMGVFWASTGFLGVRFKGKQRLKTGRSPVFGVSLGVAESFGPVSLSFVVFKGKPKAEIHWVFPVVQTFCLVGGALES